MFSKSRLTDVGWLLPLSCVALVWLASVIAVSAAQDPDVPKPASAGVYTAAQAERGKSVFGLICTSCHNTSSQSGELFAKKWRGVLVSELFDLLTTTMPKDDPGSLTLQERADVIAYLFKLNGLAAGETELSSDVEQLKKIVIDLAKHPQGWRPASS